MSNERFLVDLATNSVTYKGKRVSVRPPKLAEFLFALSQCWPASANQDFLSFAVWGVNGAPLFLKRNIANYVWVARKKLKPLGVGIDNVFGRGEYRLVLPS